MKSPVDVKVGNYYLVPCIVTHEGNFPVIFPPHKDKTSDCVDFNPRHYHFDRRFLDNKLHNDGYNADLVVDVKYVVKKCLQDETVNQSAHWFHIEHLFRMYQGKKINDGICIHQGMQIVNKCGTCPGHGLKWNLKTNELEFKLPFYAVVDGVDGQSFSGKIYKKGRCSITIPTGCSITNDMPRMVDVDGKFICNIPKLPSWYMSRIGLFGIDWTDLNCTEDTPNYND